MTAQEAYDRYTIMPNLQLHQLRVAAVASLIGDAFNEPLEREEIITACLLHDMGSIIKFDLSKFPQFLVPHGLEYWKNTKESFIRKYGSEEHNATYLIAEEIGVGLRSMELLKSIGFSRSPEVQELPDYAKKISCYSDQRVSPQRVVSLEERIAEGQRRGKGIAFPLQTEIGFKCLIQIEQQIFVRCSTTPNDITERQVEPLLDQLRGFELV